MDSIIEEESGRIELILGPMFSGKSQELIRRIRRLRVADKKCCMIKYAKDTRYSSDKVSTHDQQTFDAIAVNKLSSVDPEVLDWAEVIGIDEGQFFENDLLSFCQTQAENNGKIVIVAALDGTYQRLPFLNISYLIPLSEKVDVLNAICHMCKKEACYSRRLQHHADLEVIGGLDKYRATCRKCWALPFPESIVLEEDQVNESSSNVNESSLNGNESSNDTITLSGKRKKEELNLQDQEEFVAHMKRFYSQRYQPAYQSANQLTNQLQQPALQLQQSNNHRPNETAIIM